MPLVLLRIVAAATLALLLAAGTTLAQTEGGEGEGPGSAPPSDQRNPADGGADARPDSTLQTPMEAAQAEQTGDGSGGDDQTAGDEGDTGSGDKEAEGESRTGGDTGGDTGGGGIGEAVGGTPTPPAASGFHPNYSSKYDINRNTQTWTQGLSFLTTVNNVEINNSTTISIGEDTSLGRDQRNNTSTTSLGYIFNEKLKLAGTLGITRNLTEDTRTRTGVSSDRVAANLEYTEMLPGGVSTVAVVDAGTQRDNRDDPLTSARTSNGPFAEARINFDQAGGGVLDWTFSTRYRNSQLTSREVETGTVTNDRNINADVGMSFSMNVPGLDRFRLNMNRDLSQTQQPLTRTIGGVPVVEQETSLQVNRGFSLDAGVTPIQRLNLGLRAGFRNNDVTRDLDLNRSQESIDSNFNGDLAYMFGDSTRVSGKLDYSKQRSLYDAEARKFLNGDTVNRSFGGSFDRGLGRKTNLNASGTYQIQSYLFADTEVNKDDRDVVRGDFGATADYRPNRKIETRMRFTFEHNQTIFIDRSKSSGNTTQQTYVFNPVFTYHLTPRLLFREDASAIAIARVFDFDEDRNKLSRTTEFRTSVEANLHRRVDMMLRHVFRTILDGSYRRDPEDGIRKFGKSSESVTRDLTLDIVYRPLTGSELFSRFNQRLGDTTTRSQQGNEFVDVKSTNEYTEIELGGTFNYTFPSGLKTGLRLRRVQNWTDRGARNNYFVGDLTITYKF